MFYVVSTLRCKLPSSPSDPNCSWSAHDPIWSYDTQPAVEFLNMFRTLRLAKSEWIFVDFHCFQSQKWSYTDWLWFDSTASWVALIKALQYSSRKVKHRMTKYTSAVRRVYSEEISTFIIRPITTVCAVWVKWISFSCRWLINDFPLCDAMPTVDRRRRNWRATTLATTR